MISQGPAPLVPLEVTQPASSALAAGAGPVRVLGRYRTGVNVRLGERVGHISTAPISSPVGLRVDRTTLADLMSCGDRIGPIDTDPATVVPTMITIRNGNEPDRLVELSSVAGPAVAASWFAVTPDELSARPAIDRLAIAILGGDRDALLAALDRLIGRGIGLTPSGDDAVVGVLAAAIGAGVLDPRLATSVRDLLDADGRALTTAVSLTMLRCAVDGHVSPSLRTLIMAAAEPGTGHDHELIADVAAHGHTSGRDALVGVTTLWRQLIRAAAGPELVRS